MSKIRPASTSDQPIGVIAITLGDPAGIGPEVVEKTLRDARLPQNFRFEIIGSTKGIQPGRCTRTSAREALRSLDQAVDGCRNGHYAAMVTGPVNKEAIAILRPDFVGQTEFLARACGLPDEAAVMTLTDPQLTVALCTNHCSVRDAIRRLTRKRVVAVAQTVHHFLVDSGVRQPRLAIAGINPHAGENGLFGHEDERIILPAVAQLQAEGLQVESGPADTLFHRVVQERAFDAVVCAYHDQGLIPFKLVAFDTGVNLTLGLPVIRTSPDHGTALGIAGQGKASHESMLAAVTLACRLARARSSATKDS